MAALLTLPLRLSGIASIAPRYRALLCDVWGVLHDGLKPFAPAVDALQRFRGQGGVVLLLSNSPRLSSDIPAQLAHIGVPADTYDGIITSGDATKFLLERDHAGKRYFRIGPARDAGFFAALTLPGSGFEEADIIVCSGLVDDESETPADYQGLLVHALKRNLPFICVNPDIIVYKGEKQLYCAGALAQIYESMGGESIYAGKPHRPIYDLSFARLAQLKGINIERQAIVAVGDGLKTDILGAAAAGIGAVFVTAGIHEDELHHAPGEEDVLLADFLAQAGIQPDGVLHHLCW